MYKKTILLVNLLLLVCLAITDELNMAGGRGEVSDGGGGGEM
jgi:hypothetical protein